MVGCCLDAIPGYRIPRRMRKRLLLNFELAHVKYFSVIKMASTSGNEASSETSDKLVAKSSRVKSAVWGYFGFKPDAEVKAKVSAICRLCRKTASAKCGNTSNLKTSSRPSGKDRESSKAASSGQASLLTALRPAQKYDRKSKKWQELTDSVMRCLAEKLCTMSS